MSHAASTLLARRRRGRLFRCRAAVAVAEAARRLAAAATEAHERRRAYEQLRGMSDRQLRDIGIDRGEIWARVHGTPRGRPPFDA